MFLLQNATLKQKLATNCDSRQPDDQYFYVYKRRNSQGEKLQRV